MQKQNNTTKQKIIDEYSKHYCDTLELAYGNGMMSEGGAEGVEHMFSEIKVKNKKMLDVGFGLGGVAFYLAEKYRAQVKGIEINERLVFEANQRIPAALKNAVSFHCYDESIPFPDTTFDIVYSKGVLCHLENKKPLFKEMSRVLKPCGQLVILDWLCPKNQWSSRVQEMCQLEDLTLFAETEMSYRSVLLDAGFDQIEFRNDNQTYAFYNKQIVKSLEEKLRDGIFSEKFTQDELKNAVKGYRLIAEAIDCGELLIRRITACL